MPPQPLAVRVVDPGFTPSTRDLDALIDLFVDDDLAALVERAIARIGSAAIAKLEARLDGAKPPIRARIVRTVARLGREASEGGEANAACAAILVRALHDGDAKTRRNAAIGLGHVPFAGAEEALVDAWSRDLRPEMHRSIAASLGKIGSVRVLPLLREASGATDPELARIAGRAALMVERTDTRADAVATGRVDASQTASRPVVTVALARSGLEDLLIDELAAIASVEGARFDGPGRVRLTLRGPPQGLFAARTMLSFHFPLPPERAESEDDVGDAIARALTSDDARIVFDTWTAGPARYRIAWADGGHKRAATWNAARAIARRAPTLTNDPTQSTWEIAVSVRGARVEAAIVPRALADPRFVWREGDVPAASHPTIAAALARVAGVRNDDVVWDPFVGSGAELVERALLGPYRMLIGSDVDERALAVARGNLLSAGLSARLERADALGFAPADVTLIVSNPPMGRRASRVAGLADFLDAFVAHAARTLQKSGRLVWIAPWPKRSRSVAEGAGLRLDWARSVDMGGFGAEIQRWIKSR
jgi:23S rRNA G2445 N2-methylase RlmL